MKNNYKVLDVLKKSRNFWKNITWKEDKKYFKENVLLNLSNKNILKKCSNGNQPLISTIQ